MPPAAVAIGAAVAPIILDMMFGDDGPTETAGTQQMSAAEIAEANRIVQQNQQVQDVNWDRYNNPGSVDPSVFADLGAQAGKADAFAGVSSANAQADAMRNLMGLTGSVGGGTVNAQASRQFLDDQSATQAAGGAVNTLVNGLLDFADQRMAKGGEQPVAAQPSPVAPVDGVTVGPQGPVLPGSF